MMVFTDAERAFLSGQRLGRLATVAPDDSPQNNPVGFRVADDGTILIPGRNMGATRKYRNIATNPAVAFVVDELASVDPWTVRGVEVRGVAEQTVQPQPDGSYFSPEFIRIHPRRIISWGIEPGETGMTSRVVDAATA